MRYYHPLIIFFLFSLTISSLVNFNNSDSSNTSKIMTLEHFRIERQNKNQISTNPNKEISIDMSSNVIEEINLAPKIAKANFTSEVNITFSSQNHENLTSLIDINENVQELKVVDLDNDSHSEIIIGSYGEIYVLNETGGIEYMVDDLNYSIQFIENADFNNDSIVDIVGANFWGELFFINGLNGDILFQYITNEMPFTRTMTLADFTNDSIPDVFLGLSEGQMLFYNGSNGELLYNTTAYKDYMAISGSAIGDFDKNGIPDVVAIAGTGYSEIYFLNGTNGEIMYHNNDSYDFAPPAVYYEKDGYIITGSTTGAIYFLNSTTGETRWINVNPSGDINEMVINDLNNDGIEEEIIIATEEGYWVLNLTQGFALVSNIDVTGVKSVDFYDYNKDNTTDVIAACEDGITIFSGLTGEIIGFYPLDSAMIVRVGDDYNNDGLNDMIAISDDTYGLYYVFSDNIKPVLKNCILPDLPLEKTPLDFVLEFDEPNLDTIKMGFYYNGQPQEIFPIEQTPTKAFFSIPPINDIKIQFWFWANDTFGNIAEEGNQTDFYTINFQSLVFYENNDATDRIWTLGSADFNTDGFEDIFMAGYDNTAYFIDGKTRSYLFNFTEANNSIENNRIADFNADGTPDVVIKTYNGGIFFINGQNGESLYSNIGPGYSNQIELGNFTNDDTSDIVVTSNHDIYVIDGSNGLTLWNTYIVDDISFIKTFDLSNDSIDEIILGTENGTILCYKGNEPTVIFQNDEPQGDLWFDQVVVILNDITSDGYHDIATCSDNGEIYFIDGMNGTTIDKIEITTSSIESMKSEDFNNDGFSDIVVGTFRGEIFLIDGLTRRIEHTLIVPGWFMNDNRLLIEDINLDKFPDIVFVTEEPNKLYVINGRTFNIDIETNIYYPTEGNIITCNFNQNTTLPEFVIAQGAAYFYRILVIQPTEFLDDFIVTMEIPTNINQGTDLEFSIILEDTFHRLIDNAMVTISAQRKETDTFRSFIAQPIGNGLYRFNISTSDWNIGEWNLYPIADYDPYQPLILLNYQDIDGDYHPYLKVSIKGELRPSFLMEGETGTYSSSTGVLLGVVEGSLVKVLVTLQDEYYHLIEENEAEVFITIVNTDITDQAEIVRRGLAIGSFSTNDMRHGLYNISVMIQGTYIQTYNETLLLEVIPRFPTIEFSEDLMIGIGIISFIVSMFLILSMKMIHGSFRENPRRVQRLLTMMIISTGLLFIITIIGGVYTFVSINPLWSFFMILIAFGEIVLFFFFWFTRIIYNNTRMLKFSFRTSIPIFVLLIAIALLLNGTLFLATQIEWFEYKIVQSGTSQVFIQELTLPTIFWEIGVLGFASGIVLVVLTTLYEARQNINGLKALKQKIEEDYYPKEPDKFHTEMSKIASSSFFSLFRSFLLWYILIVYTFFATFETYQYIPVLVVAAVPLLFNIGIFFRGNFKDIISSITRK